MRVIVWDFRGRHAQPPTPHLQRPVDNNAVLTLLHPPLPCHCYHQGHAVASDAVSLLRSMLSATAWHDVVTDVLKGCVTQLASALGGHVFTGPSSGGDAGAVDLALLKSTAAALGYACRPCMGTTTQCRGVEGGGWRRGLCVCVFVCDWGSLACSFLHPWSLRQPSASPSCVEYF